jgi:hypothetical protein
MLFLPITSGTIGASGDVFNMDGNGFALASGSADITFRNLVINTATDTITGNVHFGSSQTNGVTIFDIGSGGSLTLDAQAAAQITAAFGTSNLTGTNVGTATVLIPLLGGIGGSTGSDSSGSTGPTGGTTGSDPSTSTPEPSALGLLAAAVLAIGAFSFLRATRHQLRVA